ncbi:M20/M25/M40 family metallo-hydrolase [Thermoanaerobacterium sp. DL9XJH110]|uniref:M20/M25/M40 family metallo-hydrolase n=1 Tax=Thermoanaerobacterium sp. DL9XJH110 TaxID=3386643 RepID=UPI003BB7AEAA
MTNLKEKIKNLSMELTSIPSIVGTVGEICIAEKIYSIFRKIDYFKLYSDKLRIVDLKKDSLGRKYVMAFIEGTNFRSSKTILLLGHIDTVGIEDYGDLKEFATNPNMLKKKLAEKKVNQEILEDLESDNWLFGRGIFDMKAGVASLIVMMEEFSKKTNELDGNLVFIGVPDEEGNSAGMLSAVEDLAAIAEEKGWEFIAAIDTDYMTGHYPGDENKYVYIGTVGKLLPCFYVYGKETHVGEAFNGLDANLLAAEIMKQVDLSYDLCDIADGEVTLPPISLHQRDLKTEYSVQTVNAVNLYFNFATHISQPDEVLEKLKEKAVLAFENTIEKLNGEYRKFCELSNIPFKKLPWEVRVLTFEELYSQVKEKLGEALDKMIDSLVDELLEKGVDDREFSLRIVQEVHKYYPDKNPLIVLYFAPPYYPHIFVKGENEKEKRLLEAVNQAVEEAKKQYDYKIVTKKFFPYISDLSYCSIAENDESIAKLINNMPAWSRKYSLPVKAIKKISMPVVNIGPYGKDAHKMTERISSSYSFDAMPFILEKTILNLLKCHSKNS